MSRWVDFRAIKQSISIEQVLAGYRWPLQRVRRNYLRGRCPLPTHRSTRSQQSFGVDTAKNVWACHSSTCCQARGGRVGGNVLDLVAYLEGCSIREAALRLQVRCGSGAAIHVYAPLVSKGREGRSGEFLEWTPKVRQQVKGRNTLNGARYGFVPNCLQSRFEDYSYASLGCGCEAWRSGAEVPTEPENVGTVAQRMAGPRGNGLSWYRAKKN